MMQNRLPDIALLPRKRGEFAKCFKRPASRSEDNRDYLWKIFIYPTAELVIQFHNFAKKGALIYFLFQVPHFNATLRNVQRHILSPLEFELRCRKMRAEIKRRNRESKLHQVILCVRSARGIRTYRISSRTLISRGMPRSLESSSGTIGGYSKGT